MLYAATHAIHFKFSGNAFRVHDEHMSEIPAYQGLTALRPRCSIEFTKKIIMAMISQEDSPVFRGIKHL